MFRLHSPKKYKSSHDSHYVTDAFYQELIERRTQAGDFQLSSDASLCAECERFLFYEARLIDTGRFEEWLDLFTENCVYWIPSSQEADPRTSVSITFDDRRRLEDRIARLRTGFAHNQKPHRTISHFVSNVEAWESEDASSRRILSNQMIYESRPARPLVHYIARTDHQLEKVDGEWRIAVKHTLLNNTFDGIETPTLL